MKMLSVFKMIFSLAAVVTILACDEEVPQDPNAQKKNDRHTAGAVSQCTNKVGQNACTSTSGCYFWARTNQCQSFREEDLTCEQRDSANCTQSSSTTQCQWLPNSNVCIQANDTRCEIRRAEQDCRSVPGSQCAYINNSCVSFTSCEQIPTNNCNGISNCRRVQSNTGGQSIDVCVDPMKATQLEQEIRNQRQSGNNAWTTVLAGALPGAVSLVSRMFGFQSGYTPPYSGGGIMAPSTITPSIGVPAFDSAQSSDLSEGLSLDDYTQLPLLASAQQALTGSFRGGQYSSQCSRYSGSSASCDSAYPNCVWYQRSCTSATDLDSYRICRSVTSEDTGGSGSGELTSADARNRCSRYSQHCVLTQYECRARQ